MGLIIFLTRVVGGLTLEHNVERSGKFLAHFCKAA